MTLRYEPDYALKNLHARDFRAVGVRSAVDMAVHPFSAWPSFLIDLLPQGAARKRIERGSPAGLTDWELLVRGAVPGPNGGLITVRPTNKKDIPTYEARAKAELAKKKGKGVKLEKKK